jgi:UDP-glucose 4-epimerase
MRRHLITGGAGFVAANLLPRLLQRGDTALLIDDQSRGAWANLGPLENDPRVVKVTGDCADPAALEAAVADFGTVDEVWHLAANSDIPAGGADINVDLKNTFLTTTSVLQVMRRLRIPVIRFASSSAIYGDHGDIAIHEDIGPLEPISHYGAMKLASEAAIRAACESYIERADIFRFPNVVGVPATHGVLLDFVRKLKATPNRLEVLGDGTQKKPYLHAEDLVEAMLFIGEAASGAYNVFNIGPEDQGITVKEIAEIVRDALSPGVEIAYGAEPRGWVGDVPRFSYSSERLKELGWGGHMTSEGAIRRAVAEIVRQEGVG